MRIIVEDRNTGKTYKMIEWLAYDRDRIGVVTTEAERDRLIHLYEHIILPRQIVTLGTLMDGGLHGRYVGGIAIDNLDMMLSQLFRSQRVEMITMTGRAE